ncbi:MAG: 30S ribosome-binding factor RbfA [Planctomycetaceae bacterium]|nr:30S ribosome-binding factor RbfA [Planctomycetaceae bacterium]
MSTRRLLKAAEAVRGVVSMAILTQVRDPRVQDVTVTGVEMAPDMRSAKVIVSIMGSPAKQELALRGLSNSAGFLQAKIAERIDTRYIPKLRFEIDEGVKHSLEIARVLGEVLPVSDQDEVLGEESGSAQSSQISKQDPQDDAERTV